jgi:serine/threonine protein kinase
VNDAQPHFLVISIPYLDGKHVATRPKAFIPIIDHLVALHNNGFVHGDIRASNTVLNYSDTDDNKDPEGWLIDFDFGGRKTEAKYPDGYNAYLPDGLRYSGKKGAEIETWHDWYALGRLIFDIHSFDLPEDATPEEDGLYRRMQKFWKRINNSPSKKDADILYTYSYDSKMEKIKRNTSCNDSEKYQSNEEDATIGKKEHPSQEHIAALKKFLRYTDKRGWTLKTKYNLNDNGVKNGTIGTGSPINKALALWGQI